MLLVDRDAEGLFENRFHGRRAVADLFFAVHAFDVLRDKSQRPGSVKRHHGDDVRQVVRFHLHEVTRHARAFQLKDAGGVPRSQEFEGFRVINRDVIQVQLHPATLFDQVAGALHNRQGRQAQEIHLEQAQRLDDRHFELGDRFNRRLFRAAGWPVQWDVIQDRPVGNDHARSVRPGAAYRAFHVPGGVDQLFQIRRRIIDIL